jgi:hypothetical protein
MDAVWLGRLRWRRRGAWLWPAFVAATVADAAIGYALPATGDAESFAGAGVVALFLNLIAVILLSRPLGMALRRWWRKDLPNIVARDYGGTAAVAAITLATLALGLINHASVMNDRAAKKDAITRAQAWIGARAPQEFRQNVAYVSTFAIEPGRIFRECVPSARTRRTYCVIVDEGRPFPSSVRFGGYEPNSLFSQGVG